MRSGTSRNRPCPCVCGHRGARAKRQLNVVFLSAIMCLLSNANNNQTFAFHNGHLHEDDGDHPNDTRRGGAFLKTLSRIAQGGASKWGDYVTSTRKNTSSMKKSSSIYISQLHRQIQQMRTKDNDGGGIDEQTIISNDLKKKIKQQMMMEEGSGQQQQPPSEHLIQEILAYMLGGAAVGSAFAAATAGAFVGTAVVAIGAVGTALFVDTDDEETMYSLMYDEDDDSNDEDLITMGADKSCDINGEGEQKVASNIEEKKSQPTPNKSSKPKMNSFILGELRKCYNGTPYPTVLFSEHRSKDICMVDVSSEDTIDGAERQLIKVKGNCDDDGLNEGSDENESNVKLASAIEEACSSTNDCGDIMPTVEDSTPTRVEVVFPDAYAGAFNVHYYTETRPYERQQKRSQSRRVRPRPRERTVRSKEQHTDDEHWATLTDGEREGALLLSESLRVASSAFGLVADAVRFTGETAAATAGGAARLAGGAVRVSGWAVSSLGEAIENGGNARGQDGVPILTSPKENELNPDRGKPRNRQVAGSSVKLIGDAIEQVADSLLLAGSATERVAFAAAGAAEGTVRIVEDLASSLSEMFSREGRKPIPRVGEEVHEVIEAAKDEVTLIGAEELFLDVEDVPEIEDIQNAGVSTNDKGDDAGAMIELLHLFSFWFAENSDLIVAETAGVPSLAPEMLGVFVMCFLASILLLSSKEKKELPTDKEQEGGSPQRPADIAFYGTPQATRRVHVIEDDDTHSTLTNQSTMRDSPDGTRRHPSVNILQRVAHPFIFFLFLPLKLVRVVWLISWKVAFSKKTALVVIYLLGWTFLSRVSQYKSSVIQRKSELLGYKLAIQSIGKRSSPSRTESAVWLNSIIYKLWRSESGGGLEQLISASASTILASSLEHPYSKPSVVAHVSLGSLTLGSSPPIVTRIEMKGVNDKQRAIYMEVDVGMLLNDANLLLDIKPSSLEYRSLPTTKVSINSLNAKVSLFVAVKCSPNYPYVAFLEMSLADIPEYNVRIEPQNESGLKGIDFGSFPIISKWIKSSINSALADYLAPKYISIDVLAWLQGDDTMVRYYEK